MKGDGPHVTLLKASIGVSSIHSLAMTSPQYAPVKKLPRQRAVAPGRGFVGPGNEQDNKAYKMYELINLYLLSDINIIFKMWLVIL